jgi:hypothetical protein
MDPQSSFSGLLSGEDTTPHWRRDGLESGVGDGPEVTAGAGWVLVASPVLLVAAVAGVASGEEGSRVLSVAHSLFFPCTVLINQNDVDGAQC